MLSPAKNNDTACIFRLHNDPKIKPVAIGNISHTSGNTISFTLFLIENVRA